MDLKQFGVEIVKACKEYVGLKVATLSERLDGIDAALKSLPVPKDGAPGRDGLDGKDGAPGGDGQKGADGTDGQPGRDGVDGKDGAAGERGTDGAPGAKGDPGEDGAPGVDGAPGADGRDGVDGKDGQPGAPGEKGIDGAPGRDGDDGRDALDIDVLLSIDETRRYRRGTYASHNGGLWKSVRTTEGMDGWECIVEGVGQISIDQDTENPRKFAVVVATSSGRAQTKQFSMPVVIYRGVYREGDAYEAGDSVTWGGSTWIALQDTKSKPDSTDGTWKLAVKKGAPGKDAK